MLENARLLTFGNALVLQHIGGAATFSYLLQIPAGFRIFAKKRRTMQFVDVKNDIAFRKIFGNENKKVILLSFLNAVMDLQGDARIT